MGIFTHTECSRHFLNWRRVYEPLEYIETAGLEGTEQVEGRMEHTPVADDEREPLVH
jgi:hypothetical protein